MSLAPPTIIANYVQRTQKWAGLLKGGMVAEFCAAHVIVLYAVKLPCKISGSATEVDGLLSLQHAVVIIVLDSPFTLLALSHLTPFFHVISWIVHNVLLLFFIQTSMF